MKSLKNQLIENDVDDGAIQKILSLNTSKYNGELEWYFDADGDECIQYHAEIVLIWTVNGYRVKFVNFHS